MATVQAPEQAILAWRRQIHANPELSFHQHNTAGLAAGTHTEVQVALDYLDEGT